MELRRAIHRRGSVDVVTRALEGPRHALGRDSSRTPSGHPSARHQRGQSLVELALVTPLILLLFAGAGDLGRAFYGFIAIENAVKEGVLYGARYSLCDDASTLCPDPDNVAWRFAQELPPGLRNADGTMITPTVTCTTPGGTVLTDLRTCDTGFTYAVQASYTFAPLTPMLDEILGGDLTVGTRAVAIVQNEAFDPTPGIAPLKMVRASDAINATEIATKCTQPDPSGSAGYYRAPCIAADNTEVPFRFYASTTANYKIIVRNNGGTNLTSVTMADSLGWPGTCPATPTTLSVVAAPYTCSYSRTLPATVPGGGATGALHEHAHGRRCRDGPHHRRRHRVDRAAAGGPQGHQVREPLQGRQRRRRQSRLRPDQLGDHHPQRQDHLAVCLVRDHRQEHRRADGNRCHHHGLQGRHHLPYGTDQHDRGVRCQADVARRERGVPLPLQGRLHHATASGRTP